MTDRLILTSLLNSL